MPAFQEIYDSAPQPQVASFEFPSPTKDHVLRCSYDWWYPKFKTHCLKSKIIPIPQDVLDYLAEDGIILADESTSDDDDEDEIEWATPAQSGPPADIKSSLAKHERGNMSSDEDDDDDEVELNSTPPHKRFPEFHQKLKRAISQLGGAVMPKLNWSAPKDAAFMAAENTLRCINPNDIYLLLKSSNFSAHDLAHAFDGCDARHPISPSARSETPNKTFLPFAPVLVLRSWCAVQPSLEFRCFVRHNALVGITQRDRNQYAWLTKLRGVVVGKVDDFFEKVLRGRFPEHSYAFDVYIPEDHEAESKLGRVRLIDINPWAPRTDSLLFDWSELLTMQVPGMVLGSVEPPSVEGVGEVVADSEEDDEDDMPELRLVEAGSHMNLMSTEYSAHKLPREVVEAAQTPGGITEFMETWQRMVGSRGRMGDGG